MTIGKPGATGARERRRDERIVAWFTKWRLLGVFWVVQAVVLYLSWAVWQVLALNVDHARGHEFGYVRLSQLARVMVDPSFAGWVLVTLAGITLLQWLILAPVHKPRGRQEHGRPLWLSMVGAGGGIVALTTGLLFGVLEGVERIGLKVPKISAMPWAWWIPLAAWCVVCWMIATPLLVAFCRRRLRAGVLWEDLLGMIAARLFMGTIIEVAAIMPLDVLVRRRSNCYCWAGTYIALTICGAVGLAMLGPLVLLPALARRRKRWYGGHCDGCGYDMAGLASRREIDRCPECGAGWKRDADSVRTSANPSD